MNAVDAEVADLATRLRAIEDRQAIVDLKVRYCRCADAGWAGALADPDAMAGMFAQDATWSNGRGLEVRGRQAIVEFFRDHLDGPGFGVHALGGSHVEVDGDRAQGWFYAVIPIATPTDQAIWTVGGYSDRFERIDGRWLISSFTFVPAFFTPHEDGWVATRFIGRDDAPPHQEAQ